eukprot:3585422-Rhodomonas_salina.1
MANNHAFAGRSEPQARTWGAQADAGLECGSQGKRRASERRRPTVTPVQLARSASHLQAKLPEPSPLSPLPRPPRPLSPDMHVGRGPVR